MNVMTKRGSLDNVITYEHFCDTKADLVNIPKSQITLGSVAIVLQDENDSMGVYIAGSDKQWNEISTSINGGGNAISLDFVHICSSDEYDNETYVPTIEEPEENIFYLVPKNESENDLFDEWIYVNEEWEKINSTYEPGYTKSELDFKLPFGVESITVGDTILDNVTLSMQKDGDEDWYISDNISGLTTTNFKIDNYYILEIDGVSKLCRGEYLPSGYPSFNDWHVCTVVGDLGLIGKRCATPEEIAALPEGTIVHGGYYATFDNRFPEFKFDDYCIARRFKNDNNFNLYTSDTSATHTVTLKAATVVFTQVPSYLSGMNGVARYTNDAGHANTSLGNAGLQPSNKDTVHAEGVRNYVTGQTAHVEGAENVASGHQSHAEGSKNVASNYYAHVEGYQNVASGQVSHAEGRQNVASGLSSHVGGMFNNAAGNFQTVIGFSANPSNDSTDKIIDEDNYYQSGCKKHVLVVGNGSMDYDYTNSQYFVTSRSNAHTLDWHGNAEYAGDVKANACGGENPVSLVGVNNDVTELKSALTGPLLTLLRHVAYIDDQGQNYYDTLYEALYGDVVLTSIEATIAQGYEPVCTTDTLEYVRKYITVMAQYSDGTEVEVNDYTLSGTLTAGTATISVQYMNKTDTVSVDVTQLPTGYTHRSCVIANGTQYINSGLSEVDVRNFGVAHKTARTSTTTGSTHILSSTNYYMPLYRLNNGGVMAYVTCNRYGNQVYTKTDEIASSIVLGRAYELEAFMGGGDVITVDGIDCMIWPAGTTTPSASNKLTFFTYGGNVGNTSYRFVGKFYYLKLFSGSTIVHDYIPCTNGSNVAGLYDAVAGTFLTPAAGTLAWE